MLDSKKHVGNAPRLRKAGTPVAEHLESRMLLAAVDNDPYGFTQRILRHELTAAQMAEKDLELVNWNGQQTYARQR